MVVGKLHGVSGLTAPLIVSLFYRYNLLQVGKPYNNQIKCNNLQRKQGIKLLGKGQMEYVWTLRLADWQCV